MSASLSFEASYISFSIAGPWPRGGSCRTTRAPSFSAISGVRSRELSTRRIFASGATARMSSIIFSTLSSSFMLSMPMVKVIFFGTGARRAMTMPWCSVTGDGSPV